LKIKYVIIDAVYQSNSSNGFYPSYPVYQSPNYGQYTRYGNVTFAQSAPYGDINGNVQNQAVRYDYASNGCAVSGQIVQQNNEHEIQYVYGDYSDRCKWLFNRYHSVLDELNPSSTFETNDAGQNQSRGNRRAVSGQFVETNDGQVHQQNDEHEIQYDYGNHRIGCKSIFNRVYSVLAEYAPSSAFQTNDAGQNQSVGYENTSSYSVLSGQVVQQDGNWPVPRK
jgi:hypothetical protein